MLGSDAKVVAIFALAILALPPVVNGIMDHAARQADVDWLKGEPPRDANPPPDAQGRLSPGHNGANGANGANPDQGNGTSPRAPPPPPCKPEASNPKSATVSPTDVTGSPRGEVSLRVAPGDLAVVAHLEGRGVTGQPTFILLRDAAQEWQDAPFLVNQDVQGPPKGSDSYPGPRVGSTWALQWDLTNVVHNGFVFSIATLRCGGAP